MIRSPTSKVGSMDLEEMYRRSATNDLSKVATMLPDLLLATGREGEDVEEPIQLCKSPSLLLLILQWRGSSIIELLNILSLARATVRVSGRRHLGQYTRSAVILL